jgi:hypothetical protein
MKKAAWVWCLKFFTACQVKKSVKGNPLGRAVTEIIDHESTQHRTSNFRLEWKESKFR